MFAPEAEKAYQVLCVLRCGGGARYHSLSFTLNAMSQPPLSTLKILLIHCARESL